MEKTLYGWAGTIADLREWLNQFDDDLYISFEGGADDGYDFLEVKVDGKVVVDIS